MHNARSQAPSRFADTPNAVPRRCSTQYLRHGSVLEVLTCQRDRTQGQQMAEGGTECWCSKEKGEGQKATEGLLGLLKRRNDRAGAGVTVRCSSRQPRCGPIRPQLRRRGWGPSPLLCQRSDLLGQGWGQGSHESRGRRQGSGNAHTSLRAL